MTDAQRNANRAWRASRKQLSCFLSPYAYAALQRQAQAAGLSMGAYITCFVCDREEALTAQDEAYAAQDYLEDQLAFWYGAPPLALDIGEGATPPAPIDTQTASPPAPINTQTTEPSAPERSEGPLHGVG